MKNKLNNLQRQEIIDKYKTGYFTMKELANTYGVNDSSIAKLLKVNNVYCTKSKSELSRKYSINEDYFDVIDTIDKAYFLGLLYADGCNFTKRNTISICLQEQDVNILEQFRFYLNTNKPLHFRNIKKKYPNWQNMYELSINSKHMSTSLNKLGCVPAKSLILKWPLQNSIPISYIRDFVRGYFDGDGCIYIDEDYKTYRILITSSLNFCQDLQSILYNQLKLSYCSVLTNKNRNTKTAVLQISNYTDCNLFLQWIYTDRTLYLERKYQDYLIFKTFKVKYKY